MEENDQNESPISEDDTKHPGNEFRLFLPQKLANITNFHIITALLGYPF